MLIIDLQELLKNYDLTLDRFKKLHNLDKLNFKIYDKKLNNLLDDLTLDTIYNYRIDIGNSNDRGTKFYDYNGSYIFYKNNLSALKNTAVELFSINTIKASFNLFIL